MTTPTAYISLPEILLDGQPESDLSTSVIAAMVEENIHGLFRMEVVLNNFGLKNGAPDYLFFDRSKLDFGKQIGISFGPSNSRQQVFSGYVTALEAQYLQGGGSHLIVLAEDRLQDLRMTRRTRSFEDLSDSDIIQQIAQEHGLTPDINMSGPTHRSVAQLNQSDLAFIRERARAVNAELWATGDTLHVKPRSAQTGQAIELAYGVELIAFQVKADLAHQCTELAVSGWDVGIKDAIQETAGPDAVSNELNNQEDGGSILKSKFGERKAQIVHQVPLNSDEARSIAEARYREKARRFVTGSAEADGDARIQVGKTVDLSGLGQMFDGEYYVTGVRHMYDTANGFRTDFDVERPGIA